MLLAGWMSARSKRIHPTKSIQQKGWLVVGCVCLIAVYRIVLSLLEHTKTGLLPVISIGFFSLWALYGVVAVIQQPGDGSYTQYMYDILDLSTKAVFGLIVAIHTFLQLDMNERVDNQDASKECQLLPQELQTNTKYDRLSVH
jgi:bacteriorhodopsin